MIKRISCNFQPGHKCCTSCESEAEYFGYMPHDNLIYGWDVNYCCNFNEDISRSNFAKIVCSYRDWLREFINDSKS